MPQSKFARALFTRALALCVASLLTLMPLATFAQTKEAAQTPQPMGGVSTGAAISGAARTVRVVDPKAPVIFEDVTDQTTIAAFRHHAGGANKDYIFETPSGGVAIFDYDGDGRPDIYLLNGSTMAAMQGREESPHAALYRKLGNWKFEDVTAKAGVQNDRWGFGVAAGDYDNDGRP